MSNVWQPGMAPPQGEHPTRVRIFYPADPAGVVPGGIDTFIRGLIKWAPADLEFSLVGMTTDPQARPVGQWTRCDIPGGRSFDFFPAVAVNNAGGRGRVPLSLRYTAAVARRRAELSEGFEIFDFHRPEPSLLFRHDPRPKNAYFHQDPGDVSARKSDMLWRHMPGLYQRMEAAALAQLARVWCVRESGVATLRKRYAGAPEHVQFIPTWVDTDVFNPAPPPRRAALRAALARKLGISADEPWILTVGRLDTQKDPMLMFDAFERVCIKRPAVWLVVGDGVLRPELERRIASSRLSSVAQRVHLLGLQPAHEVADLHRACDLYALSSAYEGMPMALLEAQGCGLPVVTTAVGEVKRVVHTGRNGVIASAAEPQAFANALLQGLQHAGDWRGEPALQAIQPYQPATVLQRAYDSYRQLGAPWRQLGDHVRRQEDSASPLRPRRPVVGVQVDAINRAAADARILGWAAAHESRYVCFTNVHSVVTAAQELRHRLVLAGADLALPDGAPVAWTLRRKGRPNQERVDGPGTMMRLLHAAEAQGLRVGLYGGTQQTLDKLRARLRQMMPRLVISYCESPPFRQLSAAEDEAVCEAVRRAGVGLLFVGLGCPKQEAWMAGHVGRIPAVMLGVGAAFDFHAGVAPRAPAWMRERGLEWLHRLAGNPRRLLGRYAVTNTMFLTKTAAEMLSSALRPSSGKGARTATASARSTAAPRSAVASRSGSSSLPAAGPAARSAAGSNTEIMMLRTRDDTVDLAVMDDLVARIDASVSPRQGRVIEFVASSSGEGTSTVAASYASANAAQLQRKVLLLVTSRRANVGPGLLLNLARGEPVENLIRPREDGVFVAMVGSIGPGEPGWKLFRRPELWSSLRANFDLVVLDMPPIEVSRAGLKVAVACDGVVVVVEAERTRAPVVRSLIERLRAVRGNVLGTVLNKRRYHLPARLYRWL